MISLVPVERLALTRSGFVIKMMIVETCQMKLIALQVSTTADPACCLEPCCLQLSLKNVWLPPTSFNLYSSCHNSHKNAFVLVGDVIKKPKFLGSSFGTILELQQL